MELPFQQVFVPADVAVIGLLVILEGVLSIDNALVLGLLAKRLPKKQQGRALTYGLVGAFGFRLVAIATAQFLLQWTIVKLIGGAYLLYVAGRYFLVESRTEEEQASAEGADGTPSAMNAEAGDVPVAKSSVEPQHARFWPTVAVIELTDIAFAIDSILAAIALVGPPPTGHEGWHPKLWVVVTGGMLGVMLMRVAAVLFIRLLERFPRFEISAYLLVAVIGGKLTADWACNSPEHHPLDFHSPTSFAFWVFWLLMLASLAIGFIPPKDRQDGTSETNG